MKFKGKIMSERSRIEIGSVSYTHLDGYKRQVRAIALKPWPTIVSPSNPRFRKAALTVFSLMGREALRTPGNTYSLRLVRGCRSRKISMACLGNGTMCGMPVLLAV